MEDRENSAKRKVEKIIREKSVEKGGASHDDTHDNTLGDTPHIIPEKAGETARETAIENAPVAAPKKTGKRRGYITTIALLSALCVGLAAGITAISLSPSENENALEASYQRSFYDTVSQVGNIDTNLSKILATSDRAAMQKYLVDTAINSELCESDLQSLPLKDENKYYTTKLINQIGDYAKYLNNKLARAEELTEEDMAGLLALYNANASFKKSLQNMTAAMGNGYSFSNMAGVGDIILTGFEELQNLSVEYPELIYDGPFSDGKDRREIKGLSGGEITFAEAESKFKTLFKEYGLTDITHQGESGEAPACYNLQGLKEGEILYAQISKTGGKLINFSYAGSCNKVLYSQAAAEEKATEFLHSAGIDGMTAVWINLANNVFTINYAYSDGGIIIYSDLVKIRVCAETCTVIGMEASSYYFNHTARDIPAPELSAEEAQSYVSANIEVKTDRLCIVPIGETSEKLCYEFSGEYDGETYYVYIDAITGRQVEMFKVVKSTEGQLLV